MNRKMSLVLLQSAWLLGCLDDSARSIVADDKPLQEITGPVPQGCGVDVSKIMVESGTPLAKGSQYSEALNTLASKKNIRDVKIKFDSRFPAGVIATFHEAIGYMNWTYSDFRIRVVSSGENIYVKLNDNLSFANSAGGGCPQNGPWDGCASFPAVGATRRGPGVVGDSIWIRWEPGMHWAGSAPLKNLIVHEIGHAIGMHHTTSGGAVHIAGTPTGDEKHSFMSTSGIFWDPTENTAAFWDVANIFTRNDNRAMQKMYSYSKNEAMGDVDNNGKTDLLFIRASDNQVTLRLSDGSALGSPIACGTFGNTEGQYLIGDVTGDKKADLIFIGTDNKIYMRKSNGAGFNAQVVFATAFGDPRFGGVYKLLDFNGDGKKDLMFVDFNAASVNVKTTNSTGTGLNSTTLAKVFGERSGQYFTGDVTGDGKEDILCAMRPGELPTLDHWTKQPHSVRLLQTNSTGSGFGYETEMVCGDCFGNLWNGQYFARKLNADSKADLIFTSGSSSADVAVAFSNGTKIGTVMGPFPMGASALESQRLVGDFNGDGIADLIFCSASNNTVNVMIGSLNGRFGISEVLVSPGSFGTFASGQWL